MTLQEIRELDRAFLIPDEIAPILGCSAYAICVQVREDKESGINSFPFPTIRIGNRTKIPRLPFLAAMGLDAEQAFSEKKRRIELELEEDRSRQR